MHAKSRKTGIWVNIDENDLCCPILMIRYDEINYPINLTCGHTLSIQAYHSLPYKKCPICIKDIPLNYYPVKSILWANLIQVSERNKEKYCSDHPNTEAICLCINDKKNLCAECSISDSHKDHEKRVLTKFALCGSQKTPKVPEEKKSSSHKSKAIKSSSGRQDHSFEHNACYDPSHGELKLASGTDRMNEEENTYPDLRFICSQCQRSREGLSWHCNSCEYDICMTCSPLNRLVHPSCQHGDLKPASGAERVQKSCIYKGVEFFCSFCKKSCVGRSWNCAVCHDDVCFSCFPIKPETTHSCKVLQHGDLKLISKAGRLQRRNSNLVRVACDLCDNNCVNQSWSCEACDYDVCTDCRPALYPTSSFSAMRGYLRSYF